MRQPRVPSPRRLRLERKRHPQWREDFVGEDESAVEEGLPEPLVEGEWRHVKASGGT